MDGSSSRARPARSGFPRPSWSRVSRRSSLPSSLGEPHDLIGLAAGEHLAAASGPLHFDAVVRDVAGEPEVQSGIVLGDISRTALYLAGQAPPVDVDVHARADRIAVGAHPRALHEQPVLLRSKIFQETRPRTHV